MGQCMNGRCQCGYEVVVNLGATIDDSLTVEQFPFFCSDCESIVSLNIMRMPQVQCYKCNGKNVRPLTDPDLSEFRPHRDCSAIINIRSPPFITFQEYCDDQHFGLDIFSEKELKERDLFVTEVELRDWYEQACKRTVERLEKPFWGMHGGGYRCPECKEMSLRFEPGVLFD